MQIEEMIKEPVPQHEVDRQQRIESAWRHMLRSREGRRVIYDILGICHFGKSAFAGENAITNFVAGKQKVGEHVMDMMNGVYPESYALMLKELNEDEEYDKQQRNQHTSTSE